MQGRDEQQGHAHVSHTHEPPSQQHPFAQHAGSQAQPSPQPEQSVQQPAAQQSPVAAACVCAVPERQNGQGNGDDDHRDQRGGDKPEAIHGKYLSKFCEMIKPRKRVRRRLSRLLRYTSARLVRRAVRRDRGRRRLRPKRKESCFTRMPVVRSLESHSRSTFAQPARVFGLGSWRNHSRQMHNSAWRGGVEENPKSSDPGASTRRAVAKRSAGKIQPEIAKTRSTRTSSRSITGFMAGPVCRARQQSQQLLVVVCDPAECDVQQSLTAE